MEYSSSRHTLLNVFELMIEWRRNRSDSIKFNWTEFHLSIVLDYVSKVGLNPNFRVFCFENLFTDDFWCHMLESSTKVARIAASFAQELQEFFVVPKQQQLFGRDGALEQNELVAALIHLLLQLLNYREGPIGSVEDEIDCLEEELRFLLTVLGDKSLICVEHEQVQNLLAEFEAVANEAGSLVHSVVFSTSTDTIFSSVAHRLGVFLKHVDLLKNNIIKFSYLQPVITKMNLTSKMVRVDSLFIIDSLLYDLEDLLNREDDLVACMKDQIKVLQQELKLLKSFINDIKFFQHLEMEELKELVMQTRDMAYEAEYLINSFLVGDAPFWYLSIRLSHVIHKIELTEAALQEIKKNCDICASKVAKNFSTQLSLKTSRSFEANDIIVGFEEEAEIILDQLVGGTKHLHIISIFGMPGLGKTTFAKKLYNHPLVKDKFDKCSWCVVSQTYHRKNLLIDILVSSKGQHDKVEMLNMEEEILVANIYKSLKGRRYLIVMDDIWSSNAWYDLRRCFPDDGNGSRILFTSRNKDVAPPNSIVYELPSMSDEKCWELLKEKVFQDESCPAQLLKTGKKIAANCHGVPLAVVAIAGILSSMDRKRSTWKNVKRNLASYIFSDQNNPTMQILELSYKHLPEHLKPCFLYFGAFPEDKEIPIRKLEHLWIAEGFIRKEEKKSAETMAEEYLMELIDKSLVIVAKRRSDGGVKTCVIHDLLLDLCLKRSKEENFLKSVDKNYSIYEKHHCLCIRISEASSQISPPFGLHVRSLFVSFISNEGLDVLNMKLLRVLDLLGTEYYNGNLDDIKLLLHLRYLAISYESLSMGSDLEPIGNLVNLEFLVVQTCYLEHIPPVMVKMMRLRYANFTTLVSFDEDCNSSQTNNLEYLSYISIRNFNDEEMLRCSPHLRKLKCECEAFWVEEKGAYRYPDFSFFTQLESLNITTDCARQMAEISLPSNIKKLVLSKLRLPWEKMSTVGRLPSLQVLKLSYNAIEGELWETRDGEFQQLRFLQLQLLGLSQWSVPFNEHFPKLRQLVLDSCKNLLEIPPDVGEIVTLQLIQVKGVCLKSLVESARQIEQEQRDIGNEELTVIFTDIREGNLHDDYHNFSLRYQAFEAMKPRSSDEEISS